MADFVQTRVVGNENAPGVISSHYHGYSSLHTNPFTNCGRLLMKFTFHSGVYIDHDKVTNLDMAEH